MDINHLADLAKLRLSKEEEIALLPQMQAIAAMLEQMPDIAEQESAVDSQNTTELRSDLSAVSCDRDTLLKNAPQVNDGCFVVPKVVE